MGNRADDGAHHKQDNAHHEQALAANHVTELADNRHCHSLCQQERRNDPRHVVDTAELADDGRQRGGENHLPQRAHQHSENEREEDDAQA